VSEAGCINFIGRATVGRIVLGFHGYTHVYESEILRSVMLRNDNK